jgi:hypothetical protein
MTGLLPPDPLAIRRELAEARAEIARLRAQLDSYQDRAVYHTTSANAIAAMASLPPDDLPPGTIVRATDTGQEWEFAPDPPRLTGPWRERQPAP